MNTKKVFEEVSLDQLTEIKGGKSYQCTMAWVSCVNDTVLAGLGTSNPGGVCAYMKKVCK
ncbi:hypothetical protein FEZ51_05575 [Pediococcus stilesii]|uniref:Uncharacterized protein n=2 Tax=Pediococcus stilesii TaxID=331679 RepID=A0A5R9BVN7_9LACO|nr:hypothetical protein FEZ51_05575 [Pediococcus stilesii]